MFKPNDEPLSPQIRLNVGSFTGLPAGHCPGHDAERRVFREMQQGDEPAADINLGIVNIVVGFAPLKPAEFVVIRIQRSPGQIEI